MESKDNSIKNINEKVLYILKCNPEEVSQENLTSSIHFGEDLIADSLNSLISLNFITSIETSKGILFKYRSEKEVLKIRDLTKEDNAVYEIVIQS